MTEEIPFINPDTVTDKDSFVRFVEFLVADRVAARKVEKADPERYQCKRSTNHVLEQKAVI